MVKVVGKMVTDPKGAGKRDGGKRGAADRFQSRAKKTDICWNCGKKGGPTRVEIRFEQPRVRLGRGGGE